MKNFITKSCIFILPFILSYTFMIYEGAQDKGDLLRVGYLIDNTSNYRNIFTESFKENIYYTNFSEIGNKTNFDILTIGDSFSQQGRYGYQNYLAKDSLDIIHIDLNVNPIQMLFNLLNGDFFDNISVDYVIIQSIERYFVLRSQAIDTSTGLTLKEIKKNILSTEDNYSNYYKLFTQRVLKFPIYNFLYLLDDNAYFSDVHKAKTSRNLFTTKNNYLLFHHEDFANLTINNNKNNVDLLNKKLNLLSLKLSKIGIKLIVLPSPDKYDIYYDYIHDKTNYPKPLFFEYLTECKKNYIYIDSKNILSLAIKNTQDVYFYDDTHWSPIASEVIATNIKKIIL